MPSKPRKASRAGIYHVMLRGVNRQRIFEASVDYEQLLFFLSEAKSTLGFTLLAYCLMSNHIHLLIKEANEPLPQICMRFSARYARWFNQKYERCGHLFQGRFRSEPVETDAYFITVLTYIYQNPVKGGLCDRTQDYQWSSRRLLGKSGIIDEDELFSIVSYESILEKEREKLIEKLPGPARGRKLILTDDEVFEQMKALSGASSVFEFQLLDSETQAKTFRELHKRGVSIRQFSRLSGFGRGLIQSW